MPHAGAPPSRTHRLRNVFRIALPFLLIALGAVVVFRSPWPAILHLLLGGARVRVIWTWQTLAPLLVTGAS